MVICDYCRNELFETPEWPRSTFKHHHSSTSQWTASLDDRCGICTILATHVARALEQAARRPFPQYAFTPEEIRDAIRRLDSLPLYRVRYHPRNIRGQVFIGFESVRLMNGIPLRDPGGTLDVGLLSRQSFIAYAAPVEEMGNTTLASSTQSDQTFAQMKAWLDKCDACHPQCQHSKGDASLDKMPKRLIDVGESSQVGPPARLFETKELSMVVPYMTLSHCWGPPEHLPLECRTANMAQLKEAIPWDQLPNTFKHAMQVTRRMGQRYIWIDSICIQQGADGDFSEEGARMDLIYGRSYCNIAAVHATDSRIGLFAERSSAELEPFAAHAFWEGYRRNYNIVRSDYWGGKLLSSILYSRGWVFQERMLSPRIIHFTKEEVMWQCAHSAASESFPSGLPAAINHETGEESRLRSLIGKLSKETIDPKTRAALNSIWKMSAENYSRLNLTRFTDKVIALSGLASVISKASDETYYAGLWDFDFVEQLTWRIVGCRNASGAASQRYTHAGGYVAPSWSWLSMNGSVVIRDRSNQGRAYELSVKPEIELAWPGQAFGKLNGAYFKARAMLYRITFVLDHTIDRSWKAELCSEVRLYPDEHLISGNVAPFTTTAMMLAYTDGANIDNSGKRGYMMAIVSREVQGQYTRLGLIDFRGMMAEAWHKLEDCRIKNEAASYLHDVVLM